MAATKYTYSISGDFPNQKVDSDRLTKEIDGDATITTALDYINTAGDVCDIWFVAALSAPEITALDTVVANHSGDPIVYTLDAYEESLAFTASSSISWVQKLRLNLPDCCAGTYRVEWSFSWANSSSGGNIETRVQLDDDTLLGSYKMNNLSSLIALPFEEGMEAVRASYPRTNDGDGFARVTLTEGAHFVDIDFRASAAAYAVKLGNVRLEALEIS